MPEVANAKACSTRRSKGSSRSVTAIIVAKMALVSRSTDAGAIGACVHTAALTNITPSSPRGRGHSLATAAASGSTSSTDEAAPSDRSR